MQLRQIICGGDGYADMLALREKILRRPLGLTVTKADMLPDQTDYLLGCFNTDVLVGCLILQKHPDGWVKMRQVAVDDTVQGQGVGDKMLQQAYGIVRSWELRKIFCHARETARGFYLKSGWRVVGDTFDENNIPHCRMEFLLREEAAA